MPRLPHPLPSAITRARAFSRAAEFLFRRADASGDVYPDDPDRGAVDGVDPDQVVFLGESGEITLGIRTHELSLPAFFGRELARRGGRGVSWSIHGSPGTRLRDVPRLVSELGSDLVRADAVVLLVGINDVLRVTSAAAWERQLTATLDALTVILSRDTTILVAEIPPLDNAGSLSRGARVAAGIHGRALNRRTRGVVERHPTARAVPFPDELTRSLWQPESQEDRYTHTYKVWGAHLAQALSGADASAGTR